MVARELLQELIVAKRTYREAIQRVQVQGAAIFRAVRRERQLTQRELADALGVDTSFISKVEHAHLRPGLPVLQRLAALLADEQDSESGGTDGLS